MNIVIPKSGLPQATQKLAGDVSEFGDVIKTFEDQKNLISAQRIENDLKVHLDKFDANVLQNTDGTEEGLFDKIRAGHEEIKNTYTKQAPNFAVSRYLDRAYGADQQARLRNVQKVLDDKLFKTSYEAVQIKVDDEIRSALQTGEFGTGLQNIEEYMTAQSAFFGADADKITTDARGRYAENFLKAGLTNPQTAPMLVQRLSDPAQKQMFFSLLPVEKIDEVERLLTRAKEGVGEQQAFWEISEKFGSNYQGAYKYVLGAAAGKKYGLTVGQQQNIAQSFGALANAHKEKTAMADVETEKKLLRPALFGTVDAKKIEAADLSPERKAYYLGILKTPVAPDGFRTNPVTEAAIGDRIFADPESVSPLEIALHIGRGLSRPDAEKLINQREVFIKGKVPEHKKVQADVIFDALKEDHKAEVFGDKAEGDIEYARMRSRFMRWMIENPDKEPAVWYEEVIKPTQKSWVSGVLKFLEDARNKPLEREKAAGLNKKQLPAGAQTGTYKGVRAYKLGNKFFNIESGEEIK